MQAGRKLARQLRLKRPDHAHLVQANAELAARGVIQAQIHQSLAGVVVSLAAGNHAKAVAFAFNGVVVQAVGTYVGQRGIPFGVEQALFLI